MKISFLSIGPTLMLLIFSSVLAAQGGHGGHRTSGGEGKQVHDGKPGWEAPVHDRMIASYTLFEKAEFRTGEAEDAFVVDSQGWVGGDYQRFWWKAEGEHETAGAKTGDVEFQALYSRLFSPFWDFQTGIRIDREYRGNDKDTRGFFVVGLEGLAPYWFEVEPALFVSEEGDISMKFTASYELLLTQRLALEPRIDVAATFQDESERDLGTGLNEVEVGLRLRYEFRRDFAPYVGVTWRRTLGETAGIARRAGADVSTVSAVAGLRFWF